MCSCGKGNKENSESFNVLSRLVACSLHEQTERANENLQRGKLRGHPTLTFTSSGEYLHKRYSNRCRTYTAEQQSLLLSLATLLLSSARLLLWLRYLHLARLSLCYELLVNLTLSVTLA